MFTGQIGGGDWVERKPTCGSILKPLPIVAGGNLLHLGSWFPKKVESEQVAQLMKTDPKGLGNLYKNSHWRELGDAHSREVIIQVNECTSEKFNGRKLWKVFEGITADWSSTTFKLKDLTAESRVFYWVIGLVYCMHSPLVLSQEDQEQDRGSWRSVVWALSRRLVGRNGLLMLLSSFLTRFYIIFVLLCSIDKSELDCYMNVKYSVCKC